MVDDEARRIRETLGEPPSGETLENSFRLSWWTTLSNAKAWAKSEKKFENFEAFFRQASLAKHAAEATSDHLKKAIHYFHAVAFYLVGGMFLSLLFVEFMFPFQYNNLIMYETPICCVRSHFLS